MQKTKIKHSRALALVLLVLLMIELFLFSFTATIHAEESSDEIQYTNAYNDLKASGTFKPEDYPRLSTSDAGYYSVSLITIAESENGELFVYVYQPCADAEEPLATTINISTSVRTKNEFKNYGLTYINSYGVFYKYKVNDFTLPSGTERHYEISSVFRSWDKKYGDADAAAGGSISEVAFPVGKQFEFTTVSEGRTVVKTEDVDYIQVTNQFVGYIRYEGDTLLPSYLTKTGQDAHFIAFSTDRRIEELLEADVYYVSQDYYEQAYDAWYDETWGEPKDKYKYLDYEEKAECNVADGSIFKESTHIWDRIQTTSEFLGLSPLVRIFPGFSVDSDVVWNDEQKAAIAATDWVLSFVETDYMYYVDPDSGNLDRSFTRVGDVTILRLRFKTDGVTYDLGTVCNKMTEPKDPAATVEEQPWWLKIIMLLQFILLCVVVGPFLSPILTVFFGILVSGIKTIIKILWRILTLPLRLIFGRRRY